MSAETTAPATAEPAAVAEASPSPLGGFGADDTSRTRLFAFLGAVAVAGFCTSVLLARARAKRQVRLQPVAGRITRWPAEPELDGMQLPPVTNTYPALVARREQPSQRKAQVSVVPRDDARYDEQYEVEDLLARYSGQGRRTS